MKVGWIGLGNMGVPMVRNIAAAGIDIQAYNRTSKPDLELGSARLCTSLEDAVKDVDVVVLMLSNGQAVDDVLFAQDAVTYLRPNTLVVNMSTIGVDETLEINARLRERGHRFVDAPVLGSVKPAEDGTLTVVAGGDTEDIQALSSLFEAVSKVYFHIGEVSKGATMKLLVNAFLGMTIEALGECISFGTRNQLPKELMFDVLATSAVWAPTLAAKREMVIHDKYDAQFALKHLSKDLGLAMRQASESKVPLPAIHATRNVFLEAEQQGYGALDMSAVVQISANQTGTGIMRSAVFLDRDGVVNDHRRFVNTSEDLFVFPYAGQAIAKLNQAEFFVGLVTNQGGVGLGYMSEESLSQIHLTMEDILRQDGAHLDAIRACIHAPHAGCTCRKPRPGMIEDLAATYHLDIASSYMVGDRDVDIMAGKCAGCKTVLVGSARLDKNLQPDAHVPDLTSAVDWILQDAHAASLS